MKIEKDSIIKCKEPRDLFQIIKMTKEEEKLSTDISTCVETLTQRVINENESCGIIIQNDGSIYFKNNSFHSEFILFRNALKLKKIIRKTRIDSLLKKCKSKICRTIQEAINVLTNQTNKQNRLPQAFITNINIEFNKKYLNKSIEDIYKESKLIKTWEDFIHKSHQPISNEEVDLLKKLICMKFKDAFDSYIKSQRFIHDYNYIKVREGEKYAILFDYVAKIFVRYFLSGRGNKRRNKKVLNYVSQNEEKLIKNSNEVINSNISKVDNLKRLKFRKKLVFKLLK